jgi:RHS repeat-associated protein
MWDFVAEAVWEDGVIRHVLNSEQGVPREFIDATGKTVWQGTFDDWGALSDEKGTTTCRLRLPGQIADDETGLHYNRFRYYSPAAGQFVSPDPMGFEGGFNEFRFSPNAINWLDPLGLTCGKDGCRFKEVDPNDVNFSQTSVNKKFDTPDGKIPVASAIRKGPDQVKGFPAIKAQLVKGQLVARDGNTRLLIAQETKAPKILIEIESGAEARTQLSRRTAANGLPLTGTSRRPTPR